MSRRWSSRIARVEAAEILATRLDRPMGFLGLVFLFVVLGQFLVTEPGWVRILNITGWVFWALFVAEFALRAYIAGFQAEFWRRHWWQVIFLLLPFLRFIRALQAIRALRLARITRAARVGGHSLRRGAWFPVCRTVVVEPDRLVGVGHRGCHPGRQSAALRDGVGDGLHHNTV